MSAQLTLALHSTILDPKLPVKSPITPSRCEGFSLLECVIALFILALLTGAVLPHQTFLKRKQDSIAQAWENERLKHNARLLRGDRPS